MGRNLRILLVDDDHEDHYIIKNSFSEIGYPDVVDCLDNGLKLFQYLQPCEGRDLPALIILDMNMPRINGLETLKMLKEDDRYQHIPVVVLSTSIREQEMMECLRIGAVAYYSKPVDYQESMLIAQNIYGYALQAAPSGTSQVLWG